MSASERLAALDEAMAYGSPFSFANYDRPDGTTLAEIAIPYQMLRVALPEIVAVVRAAEKNAEKNAVTYEMRDALAALDAKLADASS